MADLAHLSDQDIDAAIAAHQAPASHLASMSDADLDKMIASHPEQSAKDDLSKFSHLTPRVSEMLNGSRYSDTGRQGTLGEKADSYMGAPVRSGLMALAQNKSIPEALSAGASQFGKDPSTAPSGYDVADKMGIQNPYLGTAVASAVDLAQLPVMEAPVAGARFLQEAGPAIREGMGALSHVAGEVGTSAAKKFGKVFASIPEETTGRYIQDRAAINAAPSREAIADDILARKKTADEHLTKAHEDLVNAKQALQENKADTRSGLQDQKYQSRQDLSEVQENFNEKKQNFKEALKSNSLTSMAGEVQSAVHDLKKQVVDGSKEGYEILGQSKAKVSVDPLVKSLQKNIDSMNVNGVAESPVAEQASKNLRDLQMRLFNMTKETEGKLTMPQAKQMLQALDKQVEFSKQSGTFSSQENQALAQTRHALDQVVKGKVPEYAEHMEGVASKTQLLGHASDLYGTPEKTISNLNGIDSERGKALHVPLLQELSKETGRDLIQPVENYLVNQKVLSTPSMFEKAIEDLPEAKNLRKAQSSAQTLANPEYARSLVEESNKPFAQKVGAAESAKVQAKNKTDLFSGITPDSVTSKTKALGGANDYGAKERFGKIDKELGTKFEKQIQSRNDLDHFAKADTHGSRKTMIGTLLGLGAGAVLGHPIMGAEIGGAAGHALDKYSGQVFKSLLDKGMTFSEASKAMSGKVLKTLSDSGIAEVIAKKDSKAIDRAVLTALRGERVGQASQVAANDDEKPQPKGGYDKWAGDGLEKLIDHSGDKSLANKKEQLLSNAKTKQLLIAASDLKSGSKAMDDVLSKIKSNLAKGGR